MSRLLTERCTHHERMDVETLDEATTARVLGALERINRWLGGTQATLARLRQFSRRWRPGERLRFLDWGTGGADVPRAIVRWCRRRGFRAEVTGIDNNPAAVAYARRASRDFPEITILEGDARAASPTACDYALSSLTLHHLSNDQIVDLLRQSDRLASRGLVMNDLKRSARAWAWIWGLTRLGRAHPIVQSDGPLSVRRAFTADELRRLALKAGLPYLNVKTHFGYRLTLAGEKA